MLLFDKLGHQVSRQTTLPTREELEIVWGRYSEQWPDDSLRYDCWKPDSILPAPKDLVKLAIRSAYAEWPGTVDWVIFSAFFIEFVDLATYLSQHKYDAIQELRAGRLMQFGKESSHDPLLMFKPRSGLSAASTSEMCKQSIVNVRDLLLRSDAWNPIDASDEDVEKIHQIVLESTVEHAALIAEWRFFILSIGRDQYDASPSPS